MLNVDGLKLKWRPRRFIHVPRAYRFSEPWDFAWELQIKMRGLNPHWHERLLDAGPSLTEIVEFLLAKLLA